MPINILMPALSPTMEKGNLTKWLKKEGDTIKSGDALAEIETDKATMEIEAADEGILARILVPDGSVDIAVNQIIAVLAEEDEDLKEVAAKATGASASSTTTAITTPEPSISQGQSQALGKQTTLQSGERIFATPLAKHLAKEAAFDLSKIKGSGPSGRIIAEDVKKALTGQQNSATDNIVLPKISVALTGSRLTTDYVKAMFEPGSYEEVALDGMRKTIAVRLLEAKQTIPHFYLTMDVELDALMALREQLNTAAPKSKDGEVAYKLSINDFVIKALALALQRIPEANAVWTEDRILRFKHSDIGVAVAVEGGLFTPVLRNAETQTLTAISTQMKELAGKAKARRLKPEEYQGGTIAVSNLGMYGVKDFAAIINPPHAAILAVGAGEQRIIAKNGLPVVAQVMSATLSCDHRVIDGALGAELLGAFRQLMENPMTMLI